MVAQLTSLFENSTSLLLAYAVPLLLISLLLTFSGTFLTLDRTRSFAPHSESTSPFPGTFEKNDASKKWSFRLDGGVGGLAIGYSFGLHTATFLSLLIMNETSAKPLSPTSFFVVWLLSLAPPIVLGGRWKMAALAFLGISGGVTLSLSLSIITHPSLASRVILTSIITPLTALIVVIPSLLPVMRQSSLAHTTARMASSCLGAFSVTMSIDLLTRSSSSRSWANAWERLWVANGSGWGTARERGFDVLFCMLWGAGAFTDWALKRWIGQDPEEKWDAYLAEYAATLPNARDRAGKFVPFRSWWTRLMRGLRLMSSSPAHPHEIIFPNESDFSNKTVYTPTSDVATDHKLVDQLPRMDSRRSVSPKVYDQEADTPREGAGILRKGKTRSGAGFKRVLEAGSTDEDADKTTFDLARRPTFLKKSKATKVKQRWRHLHENKRRAPVEFMPKEGFSSDSESDTEESSDDDQLKIPFGTPRKNSPVLGSPLVRMDSRSTTLSGTTVHPPSSSGHGNAKSVDELDVDSEKACLMNMKARFGGTSRIARTAPEYSDVEEDVTAAYTRGIDQSKYDNPGWKPEFLKRNAPSGKPGNTAQGRLAVTNTSTSPPGAVPMTPSLVYALGRIARAQADAYGPCLDANSRPNSPLHQDSSAKRPEHITIAMDRQDPITGLPVTRAGQPIAGANAKWDAFWNEIQAKAAET